MKGSFINFKQRKFRDYYESNDCESVRLYMKECNKSGNRLTEEEQSELFALVQNNNDDDAMNKLVLNHQPIVILMAKRYSPGGMFLDYVSEGNIALMEAIRSYDFRSGEAKFFKYATTCIKNHFDTSIKYRFDEQIKVTTHENTLHKLIQFCDRFEQLNERQPTSEEKMEFLESIGDTHYNHLNEFGYMNLDETPSSESGTSSYCIEYNACIADMEDTNSKIDAKITVDEIFKKLDDYHSYMIASGFAKAELEKFILSRTILCETYGLCGFMPQVPTEIMNTHNITRYYYDMYLSYIERLIKTLCA